MDQAEHYVAEPCCSNIATSKDTLTSYPWSSRSPTSFSMSWALLRKPEHL